MLRNLNVQLTASDRHHVVKAIEHYCKHLDSSAKEAREKLGKSEDADRHEEEARQLRAIIEPHEEGKDFDLYAGQRLAVEKGLEMLVKTMKAAKGINKSIGNEQAVGWCDAAAVSIEGSLLPQFREQGELSLVESQADGTDG